MISQNNLEMGDWQLELSRHRNQPLPSQLMLPANQDLEETPAQYDKLRSLS